LLDLQPRTHDDINNKIKQTAKIPIISMLYLETKNGIIKLMKWNSNDVVCALNGMQETATTK